MKILLVDNNTTHLTKILKNLMGHEVEIQTYQPGIDFHAMGKDLIILSGGGGEGKELHNYHTPNRLWYEDEMHLAETTDKPIIGICMGFEIIAAAFGSDVTEMPRGIEGFSTLNATAKGRRKFGLQKFWQYEAHDWRIQEVSSKHFEVLGMSERGIEIIRHKTRPIIATQFHPEVLNGTLNLRDLLKNLA